jgi:hypothetical protein
MPTPEDEHEFVLAPGEAERGVIPDHGEDEVEEMEDYDPFQHYVQTGSNPSIPLELSNHLGSLTI